jgi:hypothetical protein
MECTERQGTRRRGRRRAAVDQITAPPGSRRGALIVAQSDEAHGACARVQSLTELWR